MQSKTNKIKGRKQADFTKDVIERLRSRVNNYCSNPDCRIQTIAPRGNDEIHNVGEGAHICAASEGGPRYKEFMTDLQRRSFANGIWLCRLCHKKIDSEPDIYVEGILYGWKQDAEEAAKIALGRAAPRTSDAVDILVQGLTGKANHFIPHGIASMHESSARVLEQLDPRFHVETAYQKGRTSIVLHAREPVSLSMKVMVPSDAGYIDRHMQLIEHGLDFEIPSEYIKFQGSQLFEKIMTGSGVLTIMAQKTPAVVKLWLSDGNGGFEPFNNINGLVTLGSKSFSYSGECCSDFFAFTMSKSVDEESVPASINIILKFDQWEGRNVCELSHFDEINDFFYRLVKGWALNISLEINGSKILKGASTNASRWEVVQNIGALLRYTAMCRKISRALKIDILFSQLFTFSEEDYRKLNDLVMIIEGSYRMSADQLKEPVSFTLTAGSDFNAIQSILLSGEPQSIRMVQEGSEPYKIFGVEQQIPPVTFFVENTTIKMAEKIMQIKEGDLLKIELLPVDGFVCGYIFEQMRP
ncbi:hypothetical protein [Deefgea sp. CFH1-16]|uniref:hypothetical protein n=1 Tax=Deefgea sp. CFH1-16 TaxID=2675457 RepID=UPI0015F75F52|nr:hypothetical protein [Deefgea sp. CFH1-16]MBM5573172.1 hypothetical protein [Deefgea sp. CFH1-16]